MLYPVCGMVLIKDPLQLIGSSSSQRGSSVFPLSLSEWSFTICPSSYRRKQNILSVRNPFWRNAIFNMIGELRRIFR